MAGGISDQQSHGAWESQTLIREPHHRTTHSWIGELQEGVSLISPKLCCARGIGGSWKEHSPH